MPSISYSRSARASRAIACVAIGAPGRELRHKRVVVDGHLAGRRRVRCRHERQARRAAAGASRGRRGHEAVVRIFGVDPRFDRMPDRRERALGSSVSGSPRGDADLPLHEVDTGHELRHGMLDLQPRVHLEEVERAVLVEQKLDRPGVGVADARARRARPPRRCARRCVRRDRTATGLPRAPSDAAAESSTRARRTAPRCRTRRRATAPRCAAAAEAALEIHGAVPERRQAPRNARRAARSELARVVDEAHALAAAAGDGLEHAADSRSASASARDLVRRHIRRRVAPGARHDRHAGGIATSRAAVLLPIARWHRRVGPTKVRPASRHASANAAFSARNP